MNVPRWRSIGARLLLVSCGLLIGGLIAESTLMLLGVSYPLFYAPDVYAGSRLRPGFEGWYQKEGRAYIQVNRWGFRDREHSLAKPPGTLRIAVLGDSFAEALQVPLEQTFWSVLERQLSTAKAGSALDVEVLNFGVSGYGTGQQLRVLRQYVWQFQPDVVLLAFFAGNDVRNNSKQLESDLARPFFRLDSAQDALVLDDSFLTHPTFVKSRSDSVRLKVTLINHSRLLQLAVEWRNRQQASSARQPASLESGLDAACFVEPTDGEWRQAWNITDRLIGKMNAEAVQRGALFMVTTVTSAIQVHVDPNVRKAFAGKLGVPDLEYPERHIQALGRRKGFDVIALSEPMRQYAERQQIFLHGFSNTELGTGHWNAAGHRLAGQLIAADIHRRLQQGQRESKSVTRQPREVTRPSGST